MDMDFAVVAARRRLRLVFGFVHRLTVARCFLQEPPRGGSPCTLLAFTPSGWAKIYPR